MKKLLLFYTLFLTSLFSFSQEKTEPSNIKAVQIIAHGSDHLIPIIKLGDSLTLSFDDINASETDYYYTITHCDFSWQPSSLLKSEYLSGMDDLRISNFKNSYSTLQPYTHYSLNIPNSDTNINLSGNYILSINSADGTPVFTRRFIVYTPSALVPIQIKRSRDVKFIDTKQSVQFSIRSKDFNIEDPANSLKICILQNYIWQTAITGIKPQFVLGSEISYKYDTETSFPAGNEYFYFENKDIKGGYSGVYKTERVGEQYQTILFQNKSRDDEPYTYYPDVNGNFIITSTQPDPSIEAEYSNVIFTLKTYNPNPSDEVYVYGLFSQNILSDDYKLTFNPETGLYTGNFFLKQGFYNYKFALKNSNGVNYNAFSGNFYQTENNYTVIVYYRPVGALYDRVIGVGSINSTNITL